MNNAQTYFLIFALFMAACNSSQYLVYISTDAPIPQFGNRLQVEVMTDDGQLACDGRRREIGVGDQTVWPISFGIAVTNHEDAQRGLHIRARLYREERIHASPLYEAVYIDTMGRLPPLNDIVKVKIPLSMECYGMPMLRVDGSVYVCDPQLVDYVNEPSLASVHDAAAFDTLPKPGSWPPAESQPCTEEIRNALPKEMACIPGGVFLLGSNVPSAANLSIYSIPEIPVRINRFAMDIDEFRVKDVYRIAPELLSAPGSPVCNYSGTLTDAQNDLPMNCITDADAKAVCEKQGKRLPREAEWEYVAGNLSEETTYPWGEGDECAHSIISRGRTSFENASGSLDEYTDCRSQPDGSLVPWGPVSGGHPGDVTTTTKVRNLGGNLTEWVSDNFEFLSAGCWLPQGRTWLDNPECESSAPDTRSIRGGYWGDSRSRASATFRQMENKGFSRTWVGFRCVRDLP